jgi:hypothetical protein
LAALLSTPNIFIFHLRINGPFRHCTAIFNQQSTPTGRRIYLTFISLVVYFIPFLVLVLCYTLIFIKLLCREHSQPDRFLSSSSSSCCTWLRQKKLTAFSKLLQYPQDARTSSNASSLNDSDIGRKRATTYAKARSKTFRMVNIDQSRQSSVSNRMFVTFLILDYRSRSIHGSLRCAILLFGTLHSLYRSETFRLRSRLGWRSRCGSFVHRSMDFSFVLGKLE